VKSTTHIVAATGFVAVGNIITGNPPQLPAFLMAALTSMLPDIDRPRSKVSDQTLRHRASLTGEIKIRYWRQKDNERNQDTS